MGRARTHHRSGATHAGARAVVARCARIIINQRMVGAPQNQPHCFPQPCHRGSRPATDRHSPELGGVFGTMTTGAQLQLIATCPEETKPALLLELESLGARSIAPGYRAVAFEASDALYYELHLRLRTASRLLRVIKEFPAKSAEMLRSQARRIRWDELFEARHGFMVETQGEDDADTGGMTPKQIITQVREGIREVFERAQGIMPAIDRTEPKVVVVAHLRHGRCTLSFDTSGKSLHKRGYREPGHPAPLKETLSAAILSMAGYDGSQA